MKQSSLRLKALVDRMTVLNGQFRFEEGRPIPDTSALRKILLRLRHLESDVDGLQRAPT